LVRNNKKSESESNSEQSEYAREIAEKINYLFENYRNDKGQKYSYLEVEALTEGKVHNSWLSRVASGQSPRPSLWSLKALSKVFGIDPGFWFKELDEWISEQNQAKENSEDPEIQRIALRANKLSPEEKQVLMDMIESFEKRFSSKKQMQ
jgi:transcriptional regulator with XRE-family HTH domain